MKKNKRISEAENKNFWKENKLEILLVIAVLSVIFFFDLAIVKSFSFIRFEYLDYFFILFSYIGFLILGIFLMGLCFLKKEKRRWITSFMFSIVISVVLSILLKMIISRTRPFGILESIAEDIPSWIQSRSYDSWNLSFPSFHAMIVFSLLPLMIKEFRKFKWLWISFAVLVSLSRVYFGVHYPSDIICGAIIGLIVGYLGIKLEEKYKIGKKLIHSWSR